RAERFLSSLHTEARPEALSPQRRSSRRRRHRARRHGSSAYGSAAPLPCFPALPRRFRVSRAESDATRPTRTRRRYRRTNMVTMPWTWHSFADIAYLASWPIAVLALFVVPGNRKPSSATAWLLLIVLLPYVGALLFLLVGSPKLSRRRREQQRAADRIIAARAAEIREDPELESVFDPPIPERYEPFGTRNAKLGGMPACTGNRVELIADYHEAIRRMTAAVDEARDFVHVEFYILALDRVTEPFFAALERAVRRGVTVRLLADHIASRGYPRR